MRAVVFDSTLRFDPHHRDPSIEEGECLIRPSLAGICATDLHLTRGYMNFTGILGHEMVGVVVDGPKDWRGKRVAAEINCVCRRCPMCTAGLSTHCPNRTVMGIDGRNGCFADLIALPHQNLHAVPDRLTDEQAVFVEPLAAAYQVLVQCPIDKRMTVSVVGTGRLGLLVLQVLKTTGCQLTAIGRNHKTLLLCEKMGIQPIHVDDLVAQPDRHVVVECTGSPDGLDLALRLVQPRGTVVLKSTYAGDAVPNLAPVVVNEVNIVGSRCGPFGEALNALAREAVEVRSMISRTFSIERALEAFDAAARPDNVKVLLKIGSPKNA